jgi:glycosyltransferase involved in cell wall biosynthesis
MKKTTNYPFVSVCTPTFNRRPFITSMIKCFKNQTYPMDKMEWIIIDDGTDKIEGLLKDISQVRYYSFDEKMPLGKKRNLMHQYAKGDFLIYFDDDDYYPCERVEHAVKMLQQNPEALIAGSSEMHIYFKHIKQMYQFGPYGPNHATAATFAFRKDLLLNSTFQDEACLAEEKYFLKNYTIPMVQLDPKKTILVFSHIHNTFDKKTLLEKESPYVKKSLLTIDDFIKNENEEDVKKFFLEDIDDILEFYEKGKVEYKPDVLQQMEKIKKERHEREEQAKKDHIEKLMNMNPLEIANLYEKRIYHQTIEMKKLMEELKVEKEKTLYLDKKISEIIQKSIKEKQNNKF